VDHPFTKELRLTEMSSRSRPRETVSVRLLLASSDLTFRPGGDALAAELAELVGAGSGAGARTAIVLNALDDASDLPRETRLEHERRSLATLARDASELDLRNHYDQPDGLRAALAGVGLVWVVGGNAFTLRAAMARSGLDGLLTKRVREDSIVYGGYSAGACAAGSTLLGADLIDGAGAGDGPIWGGLGLVDFSIVPHYRSGRTDDEPFERIAAHLQLRGLPHRVLRDGQAIVIAGESISLRE
jgi:dipeptidase E